MKPHIVIIADDLSGAADSGIVCAEHGLETIVLFGEAALDAHGGGAAVIAIDADTRGCDRDAAAAASQALTRRVAGGGRLLFRKVDSTLRGQIGAEIAATLAARRAARPDVCVAFTPAFPATGRTVRDGRVYVGGVPLEETRMWQLEGLAGPADLGTLLEGAGLRTASIDLDTVRAPDFAARLAAVHAAGFDVLAFDAEAEDDLHRIARALAHDLPGEIIWAGSAGLARHLPRALPGAGEPHVATAPTLPPLDVPPLDGPVLFVIGSVSPVSRRQAALLVEGDNLRHVVVPAAVLRRGAASPDWASLHRRIEAALAQGADLVVSLGGDDAVDLREGLALATAFAALVGGAAGGIGALVATGGETARAMLAAMGAHGLRLRGEIETGVPLSVAVGMRPIQVVTKAGAFGTDQTLRHARAQLRRERASTMETST